MFKYYPFGAFLARVLPALLLALGLYFGLRELSQFLANNTRLQYEIHLRESRGLRGPEVEKLEWK